MHALSGYIKENTIVTSESLDIYDGHDVIITILDRLKEKKITKSISEERKRKAAMSLAGLWIDHDDNMSVEDTVRSLRRVRSFDN